jgi:hypothetical protein
MLLELGRIGGRGLVGGSKEVNAARSGALNRQR